MITKEMKISSFIRNSLKEYLDKKEVLTIDKFESFLLKESILTKNFSNYCDEKNKEISQFRSITVCVFLWVITMRWFVMAFVPYPRVWILMADPFYLTGDRTHVNLILFGLSLMASLFRTIFISGILKK
jgi:hypothetical protein